MIHNMQSVVALLATSSGGTTAQYTFTPGPTYSNVAGRMVANAPGTGFDAWASVQPLRGKSLEKLPEGARADDWREVWVATLEEVTCGDAAQQNGTGGRRGHTFTHRGTTYEFQEVRDWRDDGGFVWGLAQKVTR